MGNDKTLVESLKPKAPELFAMSRDFEAAYRDLEIVCYYEKRESSYIAGLKRMAVCRNFDK